jgi:lysozyme family protein
MAKVHLSKALAAEYEELFSTMEIAQERFAEVDRIVSRILPNRAHYEAVAAKLKAPWFFVAAIHNMESGLRMDRHLHNGDPLTARTRQVPANRPPTDEPPFTWQESAVDALQLRKIDAVTDWNLERILYELEGYNGWGYRKHHQHVKSPYLWSFSNHYKRGKYVADGTWSDTASSRQCGAAVIIKRLEQQGDIAPLTSQSRKRDVPLRHSNRKIDRAEDLQRFLNTFPGISVRVDGKPGEKTSDAVSQIFGFHLKDDPRFPDA